ncbi:MAG: chemotaxis protein histidine kinase-like protein [Solidesulfovibrio magneticus str. Maddingley MBC34]|uniref:Chemotaxis protein histidine kinase-like protein n=1 Tax=Solidesulfovibrio magneticus str. Maddingley MBC34 TaxID=1206767 RepID=K6GJ26_9BACT|nr:MAG: chemotaxis protein histidine kinase-like protein [Solidesulfovibrio magneticus str. Maddingley MBC34]
MDQLDDEILVMFIEDSREHLGNIETALMDMERHGADIDEELVNTVFRAAHSIKGGAGFLNLANIRELAHRLENLLHMIRSRELAPDTRIINQLLTGFDRLLALVERGPQSDAEDIGELLAALSAVAEEHFTTEQRAQAASKAVIALPGGAAAFEADELSLRQAVSGGKNLYLVEYDLIHDVQARGKTPLDVITTMESSGLIVDCRMELAAVGDLDAPPVNRIPFYVLYASIVEPDIVGYLFALDVSRIHPVDLDALLPPAAAAALDAAVPAQTPAREFGPWLLTDGQQAAEVRLAPGQAPEAAPAREALLAALAAGRDTLLVWPEAPACDLALLQVLVAAVRGFAARGLALAHGDAPPPALAETLRRAGLGPKDLAEAGLPDDLFAASFQ